MENIFSKIIPLCVCVFISSCQFDGGYPIQLVSKIESGYYVVKDINTPAYGFMIVYTLNSSNNGIDGEIVSSNCNDIYYSNDTIMYSKNFVQRGLTLYYIIPINPKRKDSLRNDPIQVKQDVFMLNTFRFNKINLVPG